VRISCVLFFRMDSLIPGSNAGGPNTTIHDLTEEGDGYPSESASYI